MPNLTIRCGFPESPEGPSGAGIPSELLVFDFGAVNDDLAVCTFCFTLGEVSVTLPESFTGWDLYEFAKQLQLFHGTLQGSIEFQNWSLSMSIVFTVVNPARGTIKIGVTIGVPSPWCALSSGNFVFSDRWRAISPYRCRTC